MIFRSSITALVVISLCAHLSWAFGPEGHGLVGAIADIRLKGTPTANHVNMLLEGMSLQRAALLGDDIKALDSNPNALHLPGSPTLEADLKKFHAANPGHRDYHFTDVPVEGQSKYLTGQTGRSPTDVVHMIPMCLDVLSGAIPENNPEKITKRVAVALVAHYLGDLHQPLHVGAQYFDNNGMPTNPDTNGGTGHPDKGGNNLLLVMPQVHGHSSTAKLHSFWDGDSLDAALLLVQKEMRVANPALGPVITNSQIATFLAGKPVPPIPANAVLKTVVIGWADEIMPLAREAHSRLNYIGMHVGTDGTATGRVSPKPMTSDYREFAGQKIQHELPFAGARLAEVLKRVLP